MSWSGSQAPVWDAEQLRIATDAAGVALWSWNVDTGEIALDERARGLWGVPRDGLVTFESLSARIHPEDLDRVRTVFVSTRKMVSAYEIDFRIIHGDVVRWVSARGQSQDRGIVNRIMFGVFLDVTDRKRAEEAREILADEMTHRIKNLFALVSALTGMAARSTETTAEMERHLQERLAALGRAHELVRPLPGKDHTASLGDLLGVLLAPYSDMGGIGGRVRITAPDVLFGEVAATTLTLVVHELATNSVKYGALSVPGGTLEVSCKTNNDDLELLWTEQGGPVTTAPTGIEGFGSKLVNRSIVGQFGGAIFFKWLPEGVVITLRMSKSRVAL